MTLPTKADPFTAAYDAAAKYQNTWRREMNEGTGAVATLVAQIRSWLPLLRRDGPRFDGSDFAEKRDVPDETLEAGNRLLEVLDDATGADGKPLDYAAAAKTCLNDAPASANKEWSEVEAADSTHQKLLADVLATAAVFDLELQTFRRSLSHVAGRNDKDFQKLRSERASQTDDEDDLDAPTLPAPAAPPGAGSPTDGT